MRFTDRIHEHARRRRTAIGFTITAALLPMLGGCLGTIRGEWHMVKCTPNKEVFCIDEAAFNGDGTFEATMIIEGRTMRESGTYKFNGFKLKLHPRAGGERAYNAIRRGNSLQVKRGTAKVQLKKGRKPKPVSDP